MIRRNRMMLLMFLPALIFYGCYRNSIEEFSNSEECKTMGITYTNDIRFIINTRCNISSCHRVGSPETFSLETYEDLKAIALNGTLVKSINHDPNITDMPKNASKLSKCNIDKITAWVNDGALQN